MRVFSIGSWSKHLSTTISDNTYCNTCVLGVHFSTTNLSHTMSKSDGLRREPRKACVSKHEFISLLKLEVVRGQGTKLTINTTINILECTTLHMLFSVICHFMSL